MDYTYEQKKEYFQGKINDLESKIEGGMVELLFPSIKAKNDRIRKHIREYQSRLKSLEYYHRRGWI